MDFLTVTTLTEKRVGNELEGDRQVPLIG